MANEIEFEAMNRALSLAATPGIHTSPNPRVGCVILDADGHVVGEGFHRGAGTRHAEVAALAAAGDRARGGTVVVTLEPCDHTGRTGPCTRAIARARIARVVYGQSDPNPVAAGGATALREAGIDVEGGVLATEAEAVNSIWTFSHVNGRPFVTWKTASTLDGRVAASDGSMRWITSAQSRAEVHGMRSEVDAVLVGTGTAMVDDPQLTARDTEGRVAGPQPLRVVMGMRDLPLDHKVLDDSAPTILLRTRDPRTALRALSARSVQHVLLEGGPSLAAAFVRAGLVDRIVWYTAPVLLGSGPSALHDVGITSVADALRLDVEEVVTVGPDIRITARAHWAGPLAPAAPLLGEEGFDEALVVPIGGGR